MMRKTNNGFLKIAESSHNFFLYHYRLVVTVDAIFFYDLAEVGIGPPRWPATTWKQHHDSPLRHEKIMKFDLCCIYRLPTTTMFIVIDFWLIVVLLHRSHRPQRMLFVPEDIALFSFCRPAERQEFSQPWYWIPTRNGVRRFLVWP
jgi:hypothetical protein